MRLLKKSKPEEILFLDIETARVSETLDIDSQEFDAWNYKHNKKGELSNEEVQQLYIDRAALEPEFAKIICISMGMIVKDEIAIKSYFGDEKKLLRDFNYDLERTTASVRGLKLCGWAIIGFDIPFIFKRCMTNRITPCEELETAGEKPWTLSDRILDLKDLWKGTAFYLTSLICATVGLCLAHPKDDISGADVGRVYYNEDNGIDRIVTYCEKDVLATANVFRALRFEEPLLFKKDAIEIEDTPLMVALANGASFGIKTKLKLENYLEELKNGDDLEIALDILEALAESKTSKVTKTFIKQVKEKYARITQE